MFYELIRQFPNGHMTLFVNAESVSEARSKARGDIVAIRCLGPARVPDPSAKRAAGYSRIEWQEVRFKRTNWSRRGRRS